MPVRYPTTAMYQAGLLPYEIGPMGIAGLTMSSLPEAFLRGLEIARALGQERWQRQQYEQQMKYTQGANLLNWFFNALSTVGNVEQAKQMLTPEQKELVKSTLGVDIDQVYVPTIETVYPQADYTLVGEEVKKLGYWLSPYYTTLPGSHVKEIFGETIKRDDQKIAIDPSQIYVVPVGYQQLWSRQKQLEQKLASDLERLNLKKGQLERDTRLNTIKTALKTAENALKTDFEEGRKHLQKAIRQLNILLREQGLPELEISDEIQTASPSFIQTISDSLLNIFGLKSKQSTQQRTTTTQPTIQIPGVRVE